ncbi:MAG: hypothetical protein ABIQ88_05975 [Chitinophagaceae bacterium]
MQLTRPCKHLFTWLSCCTLACSFFLASDAQTTRRKVPDPITIFSDLPIDDPASNSVLQAGEDAAQKIKQNIFVTAAISKRRCFLGEPILLTYTLYSALQSNSKIAVFPALAGFGTEPVKLNNEDVKRTKREGKNYRVFTVHQIQLTALQEGTLTIEPVPVYNEVSYKNRVGKEMRYSGTVETAPITINVDAFPVADRPACFSGAVGNFAIHTAADTTVNAGDNNILHIEIAGKGNFTGVFIPEIAWPPGCDFFLGKSHTELNKNVFPPAGKKIFDIPFVATGPGLVIIPSLQFCFFNAEIKRYVTVYSKPLQLSVRPAVKNAIIDQAPVKSVQKKLPTFYWVLAVLLLVAMLGIFMYRARNTNRK